MKTDKISFNLLVALAVGVPLFARSPNINKFLLILLAFFWLIRGGISLKNAVTVPLFMYMGIVFLSGLVALDFGVSVRYFMQHTVNIMMVFIVADSIRDRKTLHAVIKAFLISAAAVCFIGLMQFAAYHGLTGLRKPLSALGIENMAGRITSTRRHPLVFADNISLYLPLAAAAAAYYKKYFYYACVALMFMALMLTYSRAPTAAVALVLIVSGFIFFRKMKNIIIVVSAGIILAVGAIWLFKGMPLKRRLNLNLEGRTIVWKTDMKVIEKYPLFGAGIGNVYDASVSQNRRARNFSHSHNTFIQIMAASGVFALAAFLWFLFAFFREIIRRIKGGSRDREGKYILIGLLGGFTAVLITGMTDDLFCRAEIYYPIYFFMGLAMARVVSWKID